MPGIGRGLHNSIVSKTPLSAPTNRFLAGEAPLLYLKRLQGRQKLTPQQVDGFLRSDFVDADRLPSDDLNGMMLERAEALAAEIAEATGRSVSGASFAGIFGVTGASEEAVENVAV